MRGYPQFSFWTPIALAKICFSLSHKPHKNTSVLSRHSPLCSSLRLVSHQVKFLSLDQTIRCDYVDEMLMVFIEIRGAMHKADAL